MYSQAIMTEMMRAGRNRARAIDQAIAWASDEINVLCADRDSAGKSDSRRARWRPFNDDTTLSHRASAAFKKARPMERNSDPPLLSRLVRRIASLCGSAAIP